MTTSQKRRQKRLYIALCLLLIAFFFLRNVFKKNPADFYILKPIDLNYTTLSNATVDYPKPLEMTFLQEGIIQATVVKDGDRVVKGQELVALDDFEAKRNIAISADSLKSAELKLRNAREEVLPNLKERLGEYEVNLEQATTMLKRYRNVEASGGISRAELEKAEKEYQRALSQYNQQKLELENISRTGLLADLENQLSIARAQYELAVRRLQNSRINAPFDGTVLKVHVQTGQKVTPAIRAVTLIENAPWQLVLNVDQRELPFLKPGLAAQVVMDAYPDTKIEGRVSYVCTEVDKEKNTCELRVEIKDEKGIIKPGMAGKAEILAAKFEKVLALPSRFVKKDAGGNSVWIWDGRRASLFRPDVRAIGERWVIVEGVAENSVILDADIQAKAARLRPGAETAAPR